MTLHRYEPCDGVLLCGAPLDKHPMVALDDYETTCSTCVRILSTENEARARRLSVAFATLNPCAAWSMAGRARLADARRAPRSGALEPDETTGGCLRTPG